MTNNLFDTHFSFLRDKNIFDTADFINQNEPRQFKDTQEVVIQNHTRRSK